MKDKYEKVILGVAVVIAIAMVALGVLKLGAVEADFPPPGERPSGANPIPSEPFITKNAAHLSNPPKLEQAVTDKGRPVDCHTGVPLYVRKNVDLKLTVDLEDPDGEPVHPPIPNSWFIKHGMSKEIGFGNAPQLDFDADGFSNLEEYKVGTKPNDKNSFPSLFAKIKISSIDFERWVMRFSDSGNGSYTFRITGTADQQKRKIENKNRFDTPIKVGDTFFATEPYKGRFKLEEIFEKQVRNIPKKFAKVQDLQAGKGNRNYEIASSTRDQKEVKDFTVRLFLDTPDHRDNIFALEEGASFSLPFDKEAAEKPYTLKEIGADGTTILLLWDNNGETKELELKLQN